jgi:hypothetical protein
MESYYVDLLLQEWAFGKHSVKLEKAVKRVLSELHPATLLFPAPTIRNDY